MSPDPFFPRSAPQGDDGLRVRVALGGDAFDIARIYNHYVDVGGATFDATPWTLEFAKGLLAAAKPEAWFVADEKGDVIGWASVRRYSLRHGYRFTCETAIYLDPVAVGRGVGDALQIRLEEHCRKSGVHHAVAKVIADNERSMAFHHRYGYELVGIQKEIGHMNGQWTDVAILQKIFE
jgi:phosphinothricin acetyltransferase